MAGKYTPGIIDAEKRDFISLQDRAEDQRAAAQKYIADQYSHNIYALNGYVNTVDSIARLGSPLTWEEFERRLKKLPHGDKLVFVGYVRPFRFVSVLGANGERYNISAYGRVPNIPEWSTMDIKEIVVPDMSVKHLAFRDYPELEWRGDRSVGLDNVLNQKGFHTVDGSLKPGWKTEYQMIGENPNDPWSRGWRTVLSRWLKIGAGSRGLIPYPSPAAIEKEFGTADSPQWAKHMGHQHVDSPF